MLPANKKTKLQTEKYDEQKKIPSKGKKITLTLQREPLFSIGFPPFPGHTHTEKNERQSAKLKKIVTPKPNEKITTNFSPRPI